MKGWAIPIIVSILIIGGIGFSQQVFADGTVDQQNLISNGGLGMHTAGQGFTPTVSNLIAVDMTLRDSGNVAACSGDSWTVNIREGSDLSGTIVGTASHIVVAPPLTQHIHFPGSVSLVSGNPYMIEIISSLAGVCLWATQNTNVYPGGALLGFPNDDAVFTTFFSDIVVGGTSIPIDTTSLLLAGATLHVWMIPVLAVGAVIGVFVIKRKK